MCGYCDEYNEFPPVTFGGPTGDYFIEVPVSSARWAEYAIVGVTSSAAANYFITGDSKPVQLDYTGARTLSDGSFISGIAISTSSSNLSYAYNADVFFRITHSQKRVFCRIDTTSNQSAYVTIKFRTKLITVVPGPSLTTHPDSAHQINIAREGKTRERLATMGIPGYALEDK